MNNVNGHLGCIHVLATVKSSELNMIQKQSWQLWWFYFRILWENLMKHLFICFSESQSKAAYFLSDILQILQYGVTIFWALWTCHLQ